MASITGKAGAVTFAGSAVNGKITNWRMTKRSRNVEGTGAGDTLVERVHLVKDWEVEVEWNAPDQASWDQHQDLAGTSVAIALKRKSGDANPYASGTGLYEEGTVEAPYDGIIKGRGRIVCEGTDLTIDTTPAT